MRTAIPEQHRSSTGADIDALACRFKVLNERAPLIFLYLRNVTVGTNGTIEWDETDAPSGFQDTDVVAASPVLDLSAPNEPTHVHMSYTDTEGWV